MTDPRITEAGARALADNWPSLFAWDESWDEMSKGQRGEYRTVAGHVLAAVYPLIERAVIERLAGEAGGWRSELALACYAPDSLALQNALSITERAVAAGAAAERARMQPIARRVVDAVDDFVDEPHPTDLDPAHGWRKARRAVWRACEDLLAALAPERTTGEDDDARLRAAFDEVCDELDREGT